MHRADSGVNPALLVESLSGEIEFQLTQLIDATTQSLEDSLELTHQTRSILFSIILPTQGRVGH